jgi:hypothetical protein
LSAPALNSSYASQQTPTVFEHLFEYSYSLPDDAPIPARFAFVMVLLKIHAKYPFFVTGDSAHEAKSMLNLTSHIASQSKSPQPCEAISQ